MKDLVAVDYAWAARTQEGDSLHSLGAPPSHKAQRTNSTSYDRLRCRLRVLRATLPPKLAEEFLEVSAAAAPFCNNTPKTQGGHGISLFVFF